MSKPSSIKEIYKRDNTTVPFDKSRIVTAISRAMDAAKEGSAEEAQNIADRICDELEALQVRFRNFIPTIEGVQDIVEKTLMDYGLPDTAKKYIIYRHKRSEERDANIVVPEHVKQLAADSKKFFRNPLSEFVYLRTYARWIEAEQRRETWIETVERYINFMQENLGNKLSDAEYNEVRTAILNQEVMPSMRLLQFAGKAAGATHVCAYNCSYIAPKVLRDFAEVMYISMCGTGVGFSVESQNIQALPQIKMQSGEFLEPHIIADSKEGWCDAFLLGLEAWFNGKDIEFDYSQLRPAGARLKTIGGKSSGPDPLRALLDFSRSLIFSRQGRRLTNIHAHDILCKIGEIVVSGGVRRSAMISLSDLDDHQMREAKHGQFYLTEPQRSIANNSAIYPEKPSNEVFMEEWIALMKSGTGERGIFNRGGLAQTLPERRIKLFEAKGICSNDTITGMIGTNPCGEIILQSKQFCNLSEVVARAEDDEASLLRKIRVATLLGTYQATLTNFNYLSDEWRENCETERLLGVSITGQWDCKIVREAKTLDTLREASIAANIDYAKRFAINASTCITCVKPSGNASQTVDSSSGMHPRYAPYYIRRIRISATDALFSMLKAQGIPYHPEVGQTEDNATTYVIDFPVKAPVGAVYKDSLSALEQLEHWKLVKIHFTEHNPSVTISVGEEEWIAVANWVYQNWNIIGGLSFLPRSNHVYQLAPYEEVNEKVYKALLEKTSHVDYSKLVLFEHEDETEIKRELACVGGACEIV